MGRWVNLEGSAPVPGQRVMHVADPPLSLEQLIVDPRDIWRSQPAVRKVVNFGCRHLASVPLHLFRIQDNDGRNRERAGRLAKLLRSPAPRVTPYRFWHTIHVDNWLFDRWAFVVLDADDEGPDMFFRVPPSRFTFRRDDFNTITHLVVRTQKFEEYHIPAEKCVFDSGYSTGWGDPVSPVDAIAATLAESDEAKKYRRDLLRNGARVDSVIERPKEAGDWTDAAWNRFREQFATYKAGGGNEGGTPILEDGMKLNKVEAFRPDTLEILRARELSDSEISTFWHIAPELLGVREGTFSNLDAFRQMLFTISLGPSIVAWEQVLDTVLLPMLHPGEDDLYVEAHVDAKLRGSWAEQTKMLTSAVGAPYMTRNEARARLNMKAIDGGDEMIVPLNVIVGGLANPSDTAPDDNGKGDDAPIKALGTKAEGLAPTGTEQAHMVKNLIGHWKRQAERIAAALDIDPDEDPDAAALPNVEGAFESDEERKAVQRIIQGHMQRVAEAGAKEILQKWNPESDGWGPALIEGWIAKAADTNASRWTHAVENGLVKAALQPEAVKAIGAFLDSTNVASSLAASFATEAASFGRHDAAKKSGLTEKTWIAGGQNPRPEHKALDGKTVGIDDLFENGLRWPGDYSGNSAETAKCSCKLDYGRES